jgi:putative ABC transport system substrate-binding protein
MPAPPEPLTAKQLDLLKSVAPSLMRLAILFNPASSSWRADQPQIEDAATASGIKLLHLEVSSEADFEPAFAEAREWQALGLMLITDGGLVSASHARIAELALQNRLPSTASFKMPYADDGFLMTYGVDDVAMMSRVADYVDRILRGAKPADLPIVSSTTFQFAINVKTAQTLGLTIPPDIAAQVTDWVK